MSPRLLLFATVLVGCVPPDDDACPAGQQACDDTCVPAGLTCCGYGNGEVCPGDMACGTSSADPCVPFGGATVVEIQGTDQPCPDFVPNPVSVRTGEPLSFTNLTTVMRTVVGREGPPPWPISSATPWASMQPGESSGSIAFDSAGTYSFATTTHLGSCDTRWGQLFVTVN